jgi:Zn-finger nucleic acid-binding protein
MDAHPYGGGGNAVVDTCLRCNVIWLDAEELSIIGRYVPYVPRREPPTLLERSIAAEETETNLLEIW